MAGDDIERRPRPIPRLKAGKTVRIPSGGPRDLLATAREITGAKVPDESYDPNPAVAPSEVGGESLPLGPIEVNKGDNYKEVADQIKERGGAKIELTDDNSNSAFKEAGRIAEAAGIDITGKTPTELKELFNPRWSGSKLTFTIPEHLLPKEEPGETPDPAPIESPVTGPSGVVDAGWAAAAPSAPTPDTEEPPAPATAPPAAPAAPPSATPSEAAPDTAQVSPTSTAGPAEGVSSENADDDLLDDILGDMKDAGLEVRDQPVQQDDKGAEAAEPASSSAKSGEDDKSVDTAATANLSPSPASASPQPTASPAPTASSGNVKEELASFFEDALEEAGGPEDKGGAPAASAPPPATAPADAPAAVTADRSESPKAAEIDNEPLIIDLTDLSAKQILEGGADSAVQQLIEAMREGRPAAPIAGLHSEAKRRAMVNVLNTHQDEVQARLGPLGADGLPVLEIDLVEAPSAAPAPTRSAAPAAAGGPPGSPDGGGSPEAKPGAAEGASAVEDDTPTVKVDVGGLAVQFGAERMRPGQSLELRDDQREEFIKALRVAFREAMEEAERTGQEFEFTGVWDPEVIDLINDVQAEEIGAAGSSAEAVKSRQGVENGYHWSVVVGRVPAGRSNGENGVYRLRVQGRWEIPGRRTIENERAALGEKLSPEEQAHIALREKTPGLTETRGNFDKYIDDLIDRLGAGEDVIDDIDGKGVAEKARLELKGRAPALIANGIYELGITPREVNNIIGRMGLNRAEQAELRRGIEFTVLNYFDEASLGFGVANPGNDRFLALWDARCTRALEEEARGQRLDLARGQYESQIKVGSVPDLNDIISLRYTPSELEALLRDKFALDWATAQQQLLHIEDKLLSDLAVGGLNLENLRLRRAWDRARAVREANQMGAAVAATGEIFDPPSLTDVIALEREIADLLKNPPAEKLQKVQELRQGRKDLEDHCRQELMGEFRNEGVFADYLSNQIFENVITPQEVSALLDRLGVRGAAANSLLRTTEAMLIDIYRSEAAPSTNSLQDAVQKLWRLQMARRQGRVAAGGTTPPSPDGGPSGPEPDPGAPLTPEQELIKKHREDPDWVARATEFSRHMDEDLKDQFGTPDYFGELANGIRDNLLLPDDMVWLLGQGHLDLTPDQREQALREVSRLLNKYFQESINDAKTSDQITFGLAWQNNPDHQARLQQLEAEARAQTQVQTSAPDQQAGPASPDATSQRKGIRDRLPGWLGGRKRPDDARNSNGGAASPDAGAAGVDNANRAPARSVDEIRALNGIGAIEEGLNKAASDEEKNNYRRALVASLVEQQVTPQEFGPWSALLEDSGRADFYRRVFRESRYHPSEWTNDWSQSQEYAQAQQRLEAESMPWLATPDQRADFEENVRNRTDIVRDRYNFEDWLENAAGIQGATPEERRTAFLESYRQMLAADNKSVGVEPEAVLANMGRTMAHLHYTPAQCGFMARSMGLSGEDMAALGGGLIQRAHEMINDTSAFRANPIGTAVFARVWENSGTYLASIAPDPNQDLEVVRSTNSLKRAQALIDGFDDFVGRRNSPVPPDLLARSIGIELGRSNYSKDEVLQFVNSGLNGQDARAIAMGQFEIVRREENLATVNSRIRQLRDENQITEDQAAAIYRDVDVILNPDFDDKPERVQAISDLGDIVIYDGLDKVRQTGDKEAGRLWLRIMDVVDLRRLITDEESRQFMRQMREYINKAEQN